ncbi:unnamed protein product [Cylindrotheca closterium]|uniref:ubiquitinyl hydrolase 1 n=1 Tax=Cylindrotheca closterium TaxID=2856 RepID=A0AAD2PXP3_9STRA|nr:unnamed protein product [Cylindrotheca closterium]
MSGTTEESHVRVLQAPLKRDVARPVANLGNTCYMNAVLQALAHAPELCMALDVESHHVNCPVFTENDLKRRPSPSSSPDGEDTAFKPTGTRKSRRSAGKKSPSSQGDDSSVFCALCEMELHFARVHNAAKGRDKPVAPTRFVNGFINKIAPHFKLGQQEDAHEFLRLLIDAMQRSCKKASTTPCNPQDTPPPESKTPESEYPFQLFRGTVESNVTCAACNAKSSKIDPIEDIGLDVSQASSSSGVLSDVGSALKRFARAEPLDTGYKCESCGAVGQATKQSRLASIPPILTLHLKRFRYGAEAQKTVLTGTGPGGRRSNRSELSQLLGSGTADFYGGKSGSAKIEGHSKYEQILDLKPYLTEELQSQHSKMFCRLFAVIVHAGKNSHSGHYVAYVRNIVKNQWCKMDDSRVAAVSVQEVMNAEAYMLLYRVVEHPVAIRLRNEQIKLHEGYEKDAREIERVDVKPDMEMAPISTEALSPINLETDEKQFGSRESDKNKAAPARTNRKRKAPSYSCGKDWAFRTTRLPRSVIDVFRDIENMISDYVQFKPEFFKLLTEQASKTNAKVGQQLAYGVSENDVQGGTGKVKGALLKMFYELEKHHGVKYFQDKKDDQAINLMVDQNQDTFL